jgi:hypothetical protein
MTGRLDDTTDGPTQPREPDPYLDTLDRMEPDIAAVDIAAAAASIAISLKRLADVLEAAYMVIQAETRGGDDHG